LEIIDRSRKKKTDKAAEKIFAAILKEIPRLEKEDDDWPNDHLHSIALSHLRVVRASHERDADTSRNEMIRAAATIVRCLKGYEMKTAIPSDKPTMQKKEPTKKTTLKQKEAEGYFNCKRTGQRISEAVCLGRREQKKRGCGSCKTGKELEMRLKAV